MNTAGEGENMEVNKKTEIEPAQRNLLDVIENGDAEYCRLYYKDKDSRIRRAVAKNIKCPREIILELAQDENEEVRREAEEILEIDRVLQENDE